MTKKSRKVKRRSNGFGFKIQPTQYIDATPEFYPAIFGDFDQDGILDVDDPDPYNLDKPSKRTIEEVKLSDEFRELIELRKSMEEAKERMIDDLITLGGRKAYGRTKTPISTINKLRRKRLLGAKGLTDMIGTTVVAHNFKDLMRIVDSIEDGELGSIIEHEDFYARPQNGYRAHHYILERDGFPIEVQVKTSRMSEIGMLSHQPYKEGNLNVEYMDFLTDLANKADKGSFQDIQTFDQIISKPQRVISNLTISRRKNPTSAATIIALGIGYFLGKQ
jgi:ppGpp synthetase/RelA/SpoT-type nucleotidyltranferase